MRPYGLALVVFLSACTTRLESASDQAVRLADAPPPPTYTRPAWVAAADYEAHDVADVELSYSTVHLPSARASETVSRRIHDWAFANVAAIEQSARDAEAESPAADLPRFSLHVSCDPKLVSADLVSIACAVDTFEGGAHGSSAVETFNYAIDGDEVRAVGLDDLFLEPRAGRAALSAVCMTELATQGAMWITEGDITDLRDEVDSFHFEKNALVFHFAPYAVGPYVEGEHTVTIPYASLRGLRPAIAARLARD